MASVAILCPQCKSFFTPRTTQHRFCSYACRKGHYATEHGYTSALPDVDRGKKGAIAELVVSADLLRRGYDVYRAVSQSAPCDLIALRGGTVLRVEVRTAQHHTDGSAKILCRRSDVGRQDVFAVMTVTGEILYRVPHITTIPHWSIEWREADI